MMKQLFTVTCVALGVLVLSISTASAMPKFSKAFEEKYVKNSDSDSLKAEFRKAKCNTCHVKGEKKDVNNDYGKVLAEFIPGDAAARLKAANDTGADADESAALKAAEEDKILKELDEAFKKAEEEKSPTGETFGERIKAGKLPQEVVEKKEE
ncbi:MAG: hypothetical protein KDA63_12645 [Planctomycetales bacterium]|nr:hypothetical protein [Planctomycetales bacterium]